MEKLVRVHITIPEKLYKALWEITARKYPRPGRKLHLTIKEALAQYIEREQKR